MFQSSMTSSIHLRLYCVHILANGQKMGKKMPDRVYFGDRGQLTPYLTPIFFDQNKKN